MKNVLVIDDEELVRFTIRRVLEKAGYEVMEAPNGKLALELQQHGPVDLVITDLHMPEMGGLETIIELKRKYPETRVIAISGGNRADDADILSASQGVGADAALHKPFKPRELIALIQELRMPGRHSIAV